MSKESHARYILRAVLSDPANRHQVPETKGLTLEEMDDVFGSEGLAVADQERQLAIEKRIGLDQYAFTSSDVDSSEKQEIVMKA